MKNQRAASRYWLVGIAALFCAATPVFSQQPPGPPPIDRSTNQDRLRQQDMSNREWQLRNFGHPPGAPSDRRQLEALMAQTEEDFNRILTLHNEIARAIASGAELEYAFVSEATGEIHKRASRLQTTLALHPHSESKVAEINNESQIKDELIKLCKQIRSFVTNPIIATPNTVDAEQLKLARRDLESVVQLSSQLKKDAIRLSKTRNSK